MLPKALFRAPLFFLLMAAVAGTIMRAIKAMMGPWSLDFSNLMHAHSHIAFQGWLYLAFSLVLCNLFLQAEQLRNGKYVLQFRITFVVLAVMFFAFVVQGYGPVSIAFSSLFQVMNYVFIFRFLRDVKRLPNSHSLLWIRTGMVFFLLSTLGPWALGIFMANGLQGTPWYYGAVYFFLHFQYNGAFVFFLFGILLRMVEGQQEGITFGRISFYLLVGGTVFGYALSLTGFHPPFWVLVFGSVGSVLSFLGMIFLAWDLLSIRRKIVRFFSPGIPLTFAAMSFLAFILKTSLQSVSVFPFFSSWAFSDRNLVIAWLHLVVIGMLTIGLVAILIQNEWGFPKQNQTYRWGYLFALCFIGTEILLAFNFHELIYRKIIFLFSAIMAIVVAAWAVSSFWPPGEKRHLQE